MVESQVYTNNNKTFWLTRIVFIRCLACLYGVAFLVAYNQNEYLLGDNGLTPAIMYIDNSRGSRNTTELVLSHPTLYWIIPPTTDNLNNFSLCGMILSIFIFVVGSANVPILFILWALYFSIVNVGQTWYSFGWESQLLEVGFLTMFMVPLMSLKRYPEWTPTPAVCVWGNRWLLFRIMIGAGMIKIRGDACWRDLTCMNYHYQTQPVPNPISIYFHFNYAFVHRLETAGNHVVELLCPWLLLVPVMRVPRLLGGAIQILFQGVLVASGNLSFLNWLTALPGVMCFDDHSLEWLFSEREVRAAKEAEAHYRSELLRLASRSPNFTLSTTVDSLLVSSTTDKKTDITTATISAPPSALTFRQSAANTLLLHTTYDLSWPSVSILCRRLAGLLLTVALAVLSRPVVMNVMSPNQSMNISFDPFRVVNSYGAFGSVTKVRHEVVLQGTDEITLSPHTAWRDFEFACKPGDINRRPCVISPYHIRIDWLMWFAAFQSYQHCPWLVHLADQLLNGSPSANRLLAINGNPFAANRTDEGSVASPPRFVRAELYEYQYASLNDTQNAADRLAGWEVGVWWKRRWVRDYMPAVERDNPSVRQFLLGNRLVV